MESSSSEKLLKGQRLVGTSHSITAVKRLPSGNRLIRFSNGGSRLVTKEGLKKQWIDPMLRTKYGTP